MHYYNEWDAPTAAWLRELIRQGHLPAGDVDERSITEVEADEIKGYTQWHFFAGIGGWPLALRLAGWPEDRPVLTGSPPCQPFSAAGKQLGVADERHLAPHWLRLVAALRPPVVFGEQVATAVKKDDWLDDLLDALEREGYATGAIVLPACGVGAPHLRQRLWIAGRLGNTEQQGLEGHAGDGDDRDEPRWLDAATGGSAATTGGDGWLAGGWERVMFAADCDPDGDGWCQVRDIDPAECDCLGPIQEGVEYREFDGILYGRMADTQHAGHSSAKSRKTKPGGDQSRLGLSVEDSTEAKRKSAASPINGHWDSPDWLFCRDGKWRPVEPSTFPLVDGVSARVVRLRGYGNAIVPQVAVEVIRELM